MPHKLNIFAIALAIFTSLIISAHAGGTGFKAEIVSLTEGKKAGEYKMVLLKHANPGGSRVKLTKPAKMVVHLRHRSGSVTGEGRKEAQYNKAIDLLKRQQKKGGQFLFGIMGSHGGMTLLKGKKNEYQSNGLGVHGDMVYSYN